MTQENTRDFFVEPVHTIFVCISALCFNAGISFGQYHLAALQRRVNEHLQRQMAWALSFLHIVLS